MMAMQATSHDTDFEPDPVALQLAKQPAHPILPRQQRHRPALTTRRERIPLAASLTGPGRAGTVTTLLGSCGSKYVGEVLAGRPHGKGQYWVPGAQPGGPLQLSYEGEFVRGLRQGEGTAYYRIRGEVFSGTWCDGRRVGPGRLVYADGAVFTGMWRDDRKHGVGTHSSPDGAIFVGNFVADRRQGLGVTFWPSRGTKHVAEWVDDVPTCGTVLDLQDEHVEPLACPQLREAIAAARVRAAGQAAGAADGTTPHMPPLCLVQPSRVLAQEFAAVRQQQEQQEQGRHPAAAAAAVVHPTSGTFSSNTLHLLRHAFILIAGGDDLAAHLLPHQLTELVVLAGLDPATPAVVRLLGQLQARTAAAGGRLSLDGLLDTAGFFRQRPLAAVAVAGCAVAAVGVEATAVGSPPPTAAGAAAAAAADDDDDDGDGDDDVLGRHIAAHRGPTPVGGTTTNLVLLGSNGA